MLSVSGMSDSRARDRDAFQDMDQLKLVQGITKYAAVPARSSQLPFHVKRAFLSMLRGRPGAAHLSVPVDLFTERNAQHAPILSGKVGLLRSAPESGAVDRVVDLLASAERPAVVAGSGAYWSGAERELREFVETARLPLFTTTLARGMVSDEHELCFGYADATINPGAESALLQADLVVVIGKRLDYSMRMGGPLVFDPRARIVQIDISGTELGLNRALEVGLQADAKTALSGRRIPDHAHWLAEVGRGCDAYRA